MRSTDECEMSRSCQSATFSSPAPRLPRSTRASPHSCSHFTGLRLCGIAARALLRPGPERLLHLAHLGALQVPDLERERLDRRAERSRTRRAARRGGRARAPASPAPRSSPSCSHTYCLDARVDVRVRADRARELADRDHLPRPAQPLDVAAHLQRPERELGAERHGLGVDAVRPPDHRRVAVLARPRGDRRLERDRRFEEQVGGPRQRAATARCRRRRST